MHLTRFIPCRIPHLLHELSALLAQEERGAFWELARVVEAFYQHAASAQTRTAETLYAPYDPDDETIPVPTPGRDTPLERLYDWVDGLFERANFDKVERSQLLTKADEEVLTNFHIDADFAAIERLAVYTRGRGAKAVRLRRAKKLFRLQENELDTYKRVAIVVRTKEEPFVLCKLFKDVPKQDLELLLPTVRIKMKLLDKLKLGGSGGAGAYSAWKIIRLAYTYAPSLTKLLAVPFKLVLLPVGLLLAGFYGGKTALNYTQIRSSYVTALAEHLYAITLASNRSVLGRLARMAGEEDTKEVLLAYALLLAQPEGMSESELSAKAGELVWDRYRARIRFDVEDALRKLHELTLIREEQGEEGEVLLVPEPIHEALRRVDRAWDDLYSPPPPDTRLLRLLRRREEAG